MQKVHIYDTTLRDGTQGGGVSFSLEDKIKIVKSLDSLGVSYIEAGNPGSNPKDSEFFETMKGFKLKNAKLVAFGSTHRVGVDVADDKNIKELLSAETEVVTIFGKAWDFHAKEVLHATLEDNLYIIRNTVQYLKENGKEVIFDAEHFFDGYKSNQSYALDVVAAAVNAGADTVVLCDTNGTMFPDEIPDIFEKVSQISGNATLGVHFHNDLGMAISNSIIGVANGACHVQGTANGFGERCGNADIFTIIPNLQLKRGCLCIPDNKIKSLREISRYIYEIANIVPNECKPYVGDNAFAHKGGMHIDAVKKNPQTFEHIRPELVGNERKFLMSEMSGRAAVISTIKKVDSSLNKSSLETKEILQDLKVMEKEGYQFEGAESSFEIMVQKKLGIYRPFFKLESFKVISLAPHDTGYSASAMIKIRVDGKSEITAAEGDGPVNALDKALRKALERFYPEISMMRLIDFKVRVLESKATASKVRVLIESTDGKERWNTVGVSVDIIDASWQALVDSVDYMLQKTYRK